MFDAWRRRVAPDWVTALEPVAPILADVGAFLRAELDSGRTYLPAESAILNAFARPLAEVRVLIVGQDPYPTPGDPMGLAFSVPRGRPMPRSLANIARELKADTGEELTSGDLTAWADQGVMLLNRCLTARSGESRSHRGHGWEAFTEHAIRTLAVRGGPLVAVLWGRDAQAMAPMLGNVPRIESPHPSPLSASRGFFGSRPFSRTNALLTQQGTSPIAWASQ
ncbi:MAG: uracil-DNA glycosylase [Actinobacteria bacterium HGW-Actinobacteria-8]|nr:MAG: uracil-DNA glycosylase [Actinobacteria bacterium HGW-Actinobacteria-8]